ncbi:MAG: SDR family NAD(P)-dependent oxidoreductase [Cypionkella sp.]
MERFKLTGRRALITGAARNIGLAISEALAEAGAHVILADMTGADGAAESLRQKGYFSEGAVLDVTDRPA